MTVTVAHEFTAHSLKLRPLGFNIHSHGFIFAQGQHGFPSSVAYGNACFYSGHERCAVRIMTNLCLPAKYMPHQLAYSPLFSIAS